MYQKSTYELDICDSVLEKDRNGQPVIYVKNAHADKPLYKVSISLKGNDLPYIDKVEYELHSTFKDRFKTVVRSPGNPSCTLVIWTWGIFTIKARATAKDGTRINLSHKLTYGDEIARADYKTVNV